MTDTSMTKTNVAFAYADLFLALLSEDSLDTNPIPSEYVLGRARDLVGTDSLAFKHLSELLNRMANYPRGA